MLKTKSILKPEETNDGWRISIMSKHTLNDWLTLDERITNSSYDEWLQISSPPSLVS